MSLLWLFTSAAGETHLQFHGFGRKKKMTIEPLTQVYRLVKAVLFFFVFMIVICFFNDLNLTVKSIK